MHESNSERERFGVLREFWLLFLLVWEVDLGGLIQSKTKRLSVCCFIDEELLIEFRC